MRTAAHSQFTLVIFELDEDNKMVVVNRVFISAATYSRALDKAQCIANGMLIYDDRWDLLEGRQLEPEVQGR